MGHFLHENNWVQPVTGSEAPFHQKALDTLLSQTQGAPQPTHSEREVAMAAVSGRMRPRIPLDRCPANPYPPLRMALAGATRRCFALLLAFPARRDEALRGALGIKEGGRGRVSARGSVGRVGWDGSGLGSRVVLCL